MARYIDPEPVSLVVFGSFARGAADASSDIDVLAVRPVAASTFRPSRSSAAAPGPDEWGSHPATGRVPGP
jgi:hypothetical protein